MENYDQIVKSLTTVRDYLRWSVSEFTKAKLYFGHGTDNAWDEAIQLIFHLINIPDDFPEKAHAQILDATLTLNERKLIVRVVETRCIDRVPLPYITNNAWFAGLSFIVDERVLIPRSPIAELIESQFQPWITEPVNHVLDLCCGSGCIGIASALYLDCKADLADISVDALAVAQKNVSKHQLADQCQLIESNLFESVKQQYDLILCNPPYVDADDLSTMPKEYLHEPQLALAAGKDGLNLAHTILKQAASFLTADGHLILEVGNSFQALEGAYPDVPFTWIEFERGGHGVCIFSRQALMEFFN